MSPMGNKVYRDSICRTVYNLIRLQGDTTRHFLTETTRLAPTSLNRILDKLISAGWISESGLADSTGGRRPNLYSQRTDNYCFLLMKPEQQQTPIKLFDPALSELDRINLPVIPTDDEQNLTDWLMLLKDAVRQMVAAQPPGRHAPSAAALITNDNSLGDKLLGSIESALLDALPNSRKPCFRTVNADDCAAYGSLWNPVSRKLGEATVVLAADMDKVSVCLAADGLRHSNKLRSVSINDLIVPILKNNRPLMLCEAASAEGLLSYFRQVKQGNDLTWDDFTKAVAGGKKKARHSLTIAAAGCASAIISSAILSESDHWILTGQLADYLPVLEEETSKQMKILQKKSSLKLKQLKTSDAYETLIWKGAAASLLEDSLNLID